MEDEDFPYIDSTIKDTRGLIHVYVAAVNKTSEVHIPNVQFPLLQDLDNDMGHRTPFKSWGCGCRVRRKSGMCQNDFVFVFFSVGTDLEDLEFLPQPSVLSLAINNQTSTTTSQH